MKKRILAAVMTTVVTLGAMTGCSNSGSTKASSSDQRTVEDIKKAGKLKVGAKSDTVNIGMIDTATGEYEGYDIDVAYEMAAKADGAIVGSAIVKLVAQYGKDCIQPVCDYVKEMKAAVERAQ